MSKKTQSAIDAIYMIYERLDGFESKLNLIDENIKMLAE